MVAQNPRRPNRSAFECILFSIVSLCVCVCVNECVCVCMCDISTSKTETHQNNHRETFQIIFRMYNINLGRTEFLKNNFCSVVEICSMSSLFLFILLLLLLLLFQYIFFL